MLNDAPTAAVERTIHPCTWPEQKAPRIQTVLRLVSELTANAKAYREFLNARAIPDYGSVEGNLGVYILERSEGEITHSTTLSFWESLAVIEGFAGADVAVAKYYPEDKDFLLEFEPTVIHYEVVGQSQPR